MTSFWIKELLFILQNLFLFFCLSVFQSVNSFVRFSYYNSCNICRYLRSYGQFVFVSLEVTQPFYFLLLVREVLAHLILQVTIHDGSRHLGHAVSLVGPLLNYGPVNGLSNGFRQVHQWEKWSEPTSKSSCRRVLFSQGKLSLKNRGNS